MLWARIRRLPEKPRRLLEVVGVAGQPLSQQSAYLASGLDVKDQASLLLLRQERLLRSAGPGIDDEIEVYHDQIGEFCAIGSPRSPLRASTGGLRGPGGRGPDRPRDAGRFISPTAISLRGPALLSSGRAPGCSGDGVRSGGRPVSARARDRGLAVPDGRPTQRRTRRCARQLEAGP